MQRQAMDVDIDFTLQVRQQVIGDLPRYPAVLDCIGQHDKFVTADSSLSAQLKAMHILLLR